MRINPTVFLALLFLIVLSPILLKWLTQGGGLWYLPHLVWLAVIVLTAWSQRRQRNDEL